MFQVRLGEPIFFGDKLAGILVKKVNSIGYTTYRGVIESQVKDQN